MEIEMVELIPYLFQGEEFEIALTIAICDSIDLT